MSNHPFDFADTLQFQQGAECRCPSEKSATRDLLTDSRLFFSTCRSCQGESHDEDSIEQPVDCNEVVFDAPPAYIPDQFVGKQLGEFLIQERIGSGGMARVYLARDLDLQRYVAVKIIQNRNYVSLDTQAKLLRAEAITQASLNHPNVVSIFHVGSHEGLPYLAMEYVDNGSLMEKIKDQGLTFEKILDYTGQIIEGLKEAYRIGLVHGDIKPHNLLIDDCGQVKLSDFGLARHVSDENAVPKMLVGTPAFMAPELFELQPIDEQSDLFSLGVTLFQMSFGKVPYRLAGETIEEIKANLEVAEIEFPDEWPEAFPTWWKEILARLLAKDRSSRYQNIHELQQDLEVASRQPAPAKPVPKLGSFLIENLIFGFLCLPLIGLLTGTLQPGPHNVVSRLAIAGPLAFFLLTILTGKTAGQLLSNTRFNDRVLRGNGPVAMAKFQFLQLLPVICALMGTTLSSSVGATVAVPLMSCGIAIGICHGIDLIIQRTRSSFIERTCGLQIVVDV